MRRVCGFAAIQGGQAAADFRVEFGQLSRS
jgi:hypothetical protein